MADASASSQNAVLAEAYQRMDNFSNFLYRVGPDEFQNVLRVRRLLDLADRRFRRGSEWLQSFFSPCTHGLKEGSECWALGYHERFNTVLNPRGMELLAARESSLAFQTMENAKDIVLGPGDMFSICVCIWMVGEHRCISKVVVDTAAVARYHPTLFWELFFSLNQAHLDVVELRGLRNVHVSFRIYPVFENANRLTELTLVFLHLNQEEVVNLCDLVSKNAGLKSLTLEDIGFDPMGLRRLCFAIAEYEQPKVLSLRERATRSRGFEDAAARLLNTKLEKLSVNLPCRFSCLFDRLRCNTGLTELEIVDNSPRLHLSLHDLAASLLINKTLKRLVLRIFVAEKGADILGGWHHLSRSISSNHSLTFLSFATSWFGDWESMAMAALADAIGLNDSLQVLSVEGCQLSRGGLMFLLSGLKQNKTLQMLKLGDLGNDERTNEQILQQVAKLGLGHRIDCVYTLRHGMLLPDVSATHPALSIRGLRLSCVEVESRDSMLKCLSRFRENLTTLCVEGVPITDAGAQCLAELFAKSKVIRNVTLLFPATNDQVAVMMGGLASSENVTTVIVGGGWELYGAAAEAFEEVMRASGNIRDFTLIQATALGFEELKCYLQRGAARNCKLSRLRLLYGSKRTESRDPELLQILSKNKVVSKWAVEAILAKKMTQATAFALTRMSDDSGCRAYLREVTGLNEETIQKKAIEALETINAQLERVTSSIIIPIPTMTSAEAEPTAECAANSTEEAKETAEVKECLPVTEEAKETTEVKECLPKAAPKTRKKK